MLALYREITVVVFRRLRKVAKSYYKLRHDGLFVRPYVRMEQVSSRTMDFYEMYIFSIICRENSSFIKILQV